jgi:acetyl-CoA carboxylase biotin carboxyl carrier protein
MDIVKTTKELSEVLKEKDLGSIFVKNGDIEINVEAKRVEYASVAAPAPVAVPATAAADSPESAPVEAKKTGNYVTSPIIGTFYAAPAPDKPPFVQIGDKVKKGQIVCIVESMKLMNEIPCDYDGTVAAILALDGEAVDFGKELIEIV